MTLRHLLRTVLGRPAPIVSAAPPPMPIDVTGAVLALLLPESYLLATQAYPFLPPRTTELDVIWLEFPPVQRAAFVLDYVSRLYRRCPAEAHFLAELPPRPTLVYRTTDHPEAVNRDARVVGDARAYAVFFDTDSGVRVELHMGHPSYFGLASVLQHVAPRQRAARV